MAYELKSIATGKTMPITHRDLHNLYLLLGENPGNAGPGLVSEGDTRRMATAAMAVLGLLPDMEDPLAFEEGAGDADRPPGYPIDDVPRRRETSDAPGGDDFVDHYAYGNRKIVADFAELASEGAFEVRRMPEA